MRIPFDPKPPRRFTTRVLSVGPVPPEWGGRLRGGVTRFHAALLGEWQSRPWRHRIEPVGALIPPPQRLKRWEAERRSPVPVLMQPEDARPRRFTRILLHERTRPDVVVVNNIAAFAPSRYTRVHAHVAPEIPILGIVHAWHQVTMKRDLVKATKNRASAQEALDRLAAFAFGSEHGRTEGVELGFRYPDHQAVIPYPLQDAYMETLDTSAIRSGVLFLGSLNRRKNPMALLEAVARIEGLPLTFAGEGAEEPALRQRAAELGVEARVRFVPHRDPKVHIAEMRELVRTAAVLCLPSRSESFGIVLIEALAGGTPVVGFGPTFTEIQDRLETDIGEPVWRSEADEVGTGIEAVLARKWDREKLRKLTVAAYSPRSVAGAYARLVRDVRSLSG
ncbi:MAG: glycosyltransferase family 4 protein [Solirubrobacterales bacterium]